MNTTIVFKVGSYGCILYGKSLKNATLAVVSFMFFGLMLFVICPSVCSAADANSAKQLWSQNYEDSLPGDIPKEWKKVNGKLDGGIGNDTFSITNISTLSGKQSLMWNRRPELPLAQYLLITVLPKMEDGSVRLIIPFLVQGAGNDAQFGIEIRASDTNDRILLFGVKDRQVFVSNAVLSQKQRESTPAGSYKVKRLSLGKYKENVWYRLVALLPGVPFKQPARVVLEKRNEKSTWEAVTEPQNLLTAFGLERGLGLMLCPSPVKGGFSVYFDDLCVEKSGKNNRAE